VLTVNMGHEEDYNSTNANKTARGLTSASLTGAPLTSITWRVQGVRGGEDMIDPVRGPLSTSGLYGERAGWSLPGYPDQSWPTVTLPTTDTRPGVSWYRTEVPLDLPKGQDTSLDLTISDDPSRKYRATLFVNGWQVGNYVNYKGPQHSFPVPNGILNPNGPNTIAIAVWNLDGSTGGLGTGLAHELRQLRLVAAGLAERQPRLRPAQVRDAEAAGHGRRPAGARHRAVRADVRREGDGERAAGQPERDEPHRIAATARRLERRTGEPGVGERGATGADRRRSPGR
jgi:hypothetical protein